MRFHKNWKTGIARTVALGAGLGIGSVISESPQQGWVRGRPERGPCRRHGLGGWLVDDGGVATKVQGWQLPDSPMRIPWFEPARMGG